MIGLKGDDEVLINNRHQTFPATYGSLAIIDLSFVISFYFIHALTFQGQRRVNIFVQYDEMPSMVEAVPKAKWVYHVLSC